jgi:hypothetical protein
MKKLYALLFSVVLSTSFITAQDYYWVGDAGDWSDLSHWATTSGGSTFQTQLPGPTNDVYFDANSFTMAGQVVTLDLELAQCKTLDCTGVTGQPKINGVGFYDDLQVFGDFIVPEEMDRNFKGLELHGEGLITIETGGMHLGGSSFFQIFGPDGEFHITDSLSTANLYVIEGKFYTDNHPVNAQSRLYCQSSNQQELHLGTSNFYTNLWDVAASSGALIDADEATIYYGSPSNIFMTFNGKGWHYHKVVFEGTVNLTGSNTFDEFVVLPGATMNMQAGMTQTADEFSMNGTSDTPVTLSSSIGGEQTTLAQTSGVVDGTWMIISDNNATGGATFNADDSIDLGNNTGWNISVTVPEDYYWVGGSGHWGDVSHWATSSGGSEFHDIAPTAIDDVYVDMNSFDAAEDTLWMDNPVMNLNNLTMNGLGSQIFILQDYNSDLNLYGSLELDDDAYYNLDKVYLLSSDNETIDTHHNLLGNNAEFFVNGGGTYDLLSGFNMRTILFDNGDFNSNGEQVTSTFQIAAGSTYSGVADFSNSLVTVRLWQPGNGADYFTVDGASFICTGSFSGTWMDYYSVTLDDEFASISSPFQTEFFEVTPGSSVSIQQGSTITAENITLVGTQDQPIYLYSSTPGTEAFISKSSGTVEAWYLNLEDNHAIGGATFNANQSTSINNVDGWNIVEPQPQDYYWVGGTGQWNDVSHWATASGGSEFHTVVPSVLDPVYFDANSFSVDGNTVTFTNIDAICASLTMTDVGGDNGIVQNNNSSLSVFGNITLDGDIYLDFNEVNLKSPVAANITTNDNSFGDNCTLTIGGAGAYNLIGDLHMSDLIFFNGDFNGNGNTISIDNSAMIDSDLIGTIDLTDSAVDVDEWNPADMAGALVVDNTSFLCTGNFHCAGLDYAALELDGLAAVWGSSAIDVFTISAGSTVQLEAGETIEIQELDAVGSSSEIIIIRSSVAGEEAFFSKESGTVDGYFLDLTDNHAIGGAVFTAFNSTLASNVEGWNFDTGIDENQAVSLSVYPNPTSGSIALQSPEKSMLKIYSLQGTLVGEHTLTKGTNQVTLNYASGGYVLVVNTSESLFQEVLIIQ